MPKHRSNSDPDDPYLPSDDEGSDPEDFLIHSGGLTSSEAKYCRGKRINLDLHTKTIIFKHAVNKGYCSKRPPTVHDLLDLIYTVQLPRQGLRATKTFIKCLASWISNNVSQSNLVGLLLEEYVGVRPPMYRVRIASALLDAARDPAFSYNSILALQRSDSPILQAHARNDRAMQLFGGQPEPRAGMEQIVRNVISHMVASGQIASPSPAPKAYHTPYPPHPGMPSMFLAAQYPPHAGAQPIAGTLSPLSPAFYQYAPPNFAGMFHQQTSQPPGPVYGPPEYLYEKDKVNANQNRIAYEKWLEYVKVQIEHHRSMETPGNAVLPADLQDAINFNNGVRDFFPQHDYIGWLIDHPEAMRAAAS